MSNIVQALESFSTSVNHQPVNVMRGDLFYDSDPVVRKCPNFFAGASVRSSGGSRNRENLSSSGTTAAIETTSATPGLKRSVGRPRKDKAEEHEPSEV